MKFIWLLAIICMSAMVPGIASAQKDTTAKSKIDTTLKAAVDAAAPVKVNADTAVIATPMNCYKQYVDYFTELGAKPVTDGMQLVVIA